MTEAAQSAYRFGAEAYDDVWSPVILPPAVAVVAEMGVGAARTILDVGAGTGALGGWLRRSAPDATVLSIDRSTTMLRVAADRRGAIGVIAEASSLPVRRCSVDAVLLAYVLFHLPDPEEALREVAAVLVPKGRVGTVTWGREWPSRAGALFDAWLDELSIPTIGATGCHDGLSTPDEVAALLETAGLTCRRAWVERVATTFDRAAFARLRLTQGRSAARIARLAPHDRRTITAELRDRLARLSSGDFAYRGEVVCASAWRP